MVSDDALRFAFVCIRFHATKTLGADGSLSPASPSTTSSSSIRFIVVLIQLCEKFGRSVHECLLTNRQCIVSSPELHNSAVIPRSCT